LKVNGAPRKILIDKINPALGRRCRKKKQDICQDPHSKYFLLFQLIEKNSFQTFRFLALQGMHYSIVLRKISQDEPKLI